MPRPIGSHVHGVHLNQWQPEPSDWSTACVPLDTSPADMHFLNQAICILPDAVSHALVTPNSQSEVRRGTLRWACRETRTSPALPRPHKSNISCCSFHTQNFFSARARVPTLMICPGVSVAGDSALARYLSRPKAQTLTSGVSGCDWLNTTFFHVFQDLF